jgi:hypothetical protein
MHTMATHPIAECKLCRVKRPLTATGVCFGCQAMTGARKAGHDPRLAQRRTACQYLVVRERKVLGYREYFGPLLSCPADIAADARRLYGGDDYLLSWRPWSNVREKLRRLARDGEQKGVE